MLFLCISRINQTPKVLSSLLKQLNIHIAMWLSAKDTQDKRVLHPLTQRTENTQHDIF